MEIRHPLSDNILIVEQYLLRFKADRLIQVRSTQSL